MIKRLVVVILAVLIVAACAIMIPDKRSENTKTEAIAVVTDGMTNQETSTDIIKNDEQTKEVAVVTELQTDQEVQTETPHIEESEPEKEETEPASEDSGITIGEEFIIDLGENQDVGGF